MAGEDRVERSASDTRARWEAFAREAPEFYIAGHGAHASRESFLAGGEAIVAPVVAYLGPERLGGHMLEIGCGIGRTVQAFAPHFERVVGVDIASAMIERARELAPPPNVELSVVSGSGLDGYEDASFDFIWSFVVFQHVEAPAVIASMLEEVGRVARPGATAIVQFDTRPTPWYVKALFALPDSLLPRTRRRGIRRHRRTPEWVRARLGEAGFRIEAEFDRWLTPLPVGGTSGFHHIVARRASA